MGVPAKQEHQAGNDARNFASTALEKRCTRLTLNGLITPSCELTILKQGSCTTYLC